MGLIMRSVTQELSRMLSGFSRRLRGVKERDMIRASILAALIIGIVALPAQARVHPVKGAAHGTATAARGVGHGAVQAGRGIVRGTVTAVRGVGRGAVCVFTLGNRCG
jgi:hypothetical protein